MLWLPSPDMDINKFVDTKLPTKREIFARTGNKSVHPSGAYSGDEAVKIGLSTTAQMERFAEAAESAVAAKAVAAPKSADKSSSDAE